MRVIAGTARGRRLKGPDDRSRLTRPTSDMLRGAIFSALTSLDVRLELVLDLYAGSGALGVEALSRGAGACDFVESHRRACAVIRQNLLITGFLERSRVFCMDASRAVERLDGQYTLVLADPPYEDTGAWSVLERLAASRLVASAGIIAIEHAGRLNPPPQLGPLLLVNSRRHGDSAASIYRR